MKEGFSVGARFPHTPAGHPLRLSQLAHLRAVSLVHFKPLGFGFQLVAAGQKEPVAVPLFGGGEVVDHQLLGVDRHPFLEDGHAFRSGVFVQIAAQLFAHKIAYGQADDLFGLIGLGVDDFDGPVPQLFPPKITESTCQTLLSTPGCVPRESGGSGGQTPNRCPLP